jgi:hypothetical protein
MLGKFISRSLYAGSQGREMAPAPRTFAPCAESLRALFERQAMQGTIPFLLQSNLAQGLRIVAAKELRLK